MTYTQPELLMSVDDLQARLNDPQLRIYDTAVYLTPQAQGGYQVDSGREKYKQAHIPGAGFIDLVNAWADTSSSLNFTLPEPARLADAIVSAPVARS